MQPFLVILADNQTGTIDWRHPNEINGVSKQEIFNLLKSDGVDPSTITEILTVEEYNSKYVKAKGKKKQNVGQESVSAISETNSQEPIESMGAEDFSNSSDFFNAMLQAGTAVGEGKVLTDNDNKGSKKKVEISEVNNDVKYFEEGGIKFKLENGILYKKTWKPILLNGQKMPSGDEAVSEYRLVSASTKKIVSVEKVELQHLEWEEVKTH